MTLKLRQAANNTPNSFSSGVLIIILDHQRTFFTFGVYLTCIERLVFGYILEEKLSHVQRMLRHQGIYRIA
jgi:hypothetical protein